MKLIGIRPGEKLHEEMISTNESRYCYDIGNFYVLIPNLGKKTVNYYKKKYKAKLVKENFEYNSKNNTHYLTIKEIKNLNNKLGLNQ